MEEANENLWCVYIHTNKINGKVYVGVTKDKPEIRWGTNGCGYRENQPVFRYAIDKYGWNNFAHEIVANNLVQQDAFQLEIELIAKYKSNCRRYKNPSYGYNMTDGGEGVSGRFCTDETRRAISEKAKERLSDPKNHPMFGTHWSEEQTEYMKIKSKEIWQNPDMRENISDKAKERWQNDEFRQMMLDKLKFIYESKFGEQNPNYNNGTPVVQLTLNDEFIAEYCNSARASEATGAHISAIRKCCIGKQKQAGGFHWKNKEDYDKLTQQND